MHGKRLLPLSAPLALVLLAGPASAGRVGEVEITQNYIVPPTIVVEANQIGYTKATTAHLDWNLGLSGHCTPHNHLVSSDVVFERLSTGDDWLAFHKWLSEDSIFDLSTTRGANLTALEKLLAVKACEANLDQLMAQGKSKAWVLSHEHKIAGPTIVEATHRVDCAPNGCGGCASLIESGYKSIELISQVVCRKSPLVTPGSLTAPPKPPIPPGPNDFRQTFGVTEATLSLTPKQASVVTQAKLTATGEITANGKGQVKYRVVHNGGKGPVATLGFDKAKTRKVTFPLTVKCSTSSGNGETKTAGRSSGGIGGLAAAPSNVKNGYVRLEIVSPSDGKKKTNDAFYSVTCRTTGTLATPLPDLRIVSAKFGPAASKASAKILVRVRNGGAKGAGPNKVEAKGTVNGVPKTWTSPVPALAAGQETQIEVSLQARGPVALPLNLRVDPDNVVKESNEGNNTQVAN